MTEWFEEWFNEEYLQLYPHRDDAEADRLVQLIVERAAPPSGGRVLDVACGAGRHARAFRQRGFATMGLDLSRALLARARLVAGVPLVRGDMRALPIRPASIDLTVNLFTSFGYFEDDADHERALHEMVATVKPGGWFVLDYLNATFVRRKLVPEEVTELAGTPVRISRWLERDGRYVMKRMAIPDGRHYTERVRLLEPGQLEAMIAAAGAHVRLGFGGYGGEPPAETAPRTILMARAR